MITTFKQHVHGACAKDNSGKYKYAKNSSEKIYFLVFSVLAIGPANADATREEKEGKQPIGEAPADDSGQDISRLFLRDSEVLLKPREIQISVGLNYNTSENQRSFRRNRIRGISIHFDISYGLTQNLEISASLPFVYNESELISATNVTGSRKSGVGDLSLGLFYTLKSESASSPTVTTSLNVTSPTGDAADPEYLNALSAGAGFWGISAGLSLSKRIDPAIVFLNIGYQHIFEDDQYGSSIQPGDTFNYGFGAGLSVNNLVAFSARMAGSYQTETRFDNRRIRGTSSEPVSFIGSMSYRLGEKTRLETTFTLGASDDAGDVGMGFSYIWNL